MFKNSIKYLYKIESSTEMFISGFSYVFWLAETKSYWKYFKITRIYPMVFFLDSRSKQPIYKFVNAKENKPFPFVSKEEGFYYANSLLKMCVYDDVTGEIIPYESQFVKDEPYRPMPLTFKD